jgi:hypothetical protein
VPVVAVEKIEGKGGLLYILHTSVALYDKLSSDKNYSLYGSSLKKE